MSAPIVLDVPSLALGCEPLGGTDWGKVDPSAAIGAVRRALELGLTVFDTAAVYGLGESERRLSQALGEERHRVFIATKCGLCWKPNAGGRATIFPDASRDAIRRSLEDSLRRLRLEAIPLLFLHARDPGTPLEETFGELGRLQQEGSIQHVGASNLSLDDLREAHRITPLSAIQVQYSLVDSDRREADLAWCAREGISVFVYGVLAQGLLTGKYDLSHQFDDTDRRHRLPHFRSDQLEMRRLVLQRLNEVAASRGKTPSQTAIRWVLDDQRVSCAIVGAKCPEQVHDNAGALDWKLSPQERLSLSEATRRSTHRHH